MKITEMVIEGVRGITGTVHLRLGDKISRLEPLDGRHTLVLRALRDIFYSGDQYRGLQKAIDNNAENSRIALTFIDSGQHIDSEHHHYRFLKDYKKGSLYLLEQKAEEGSFALVSKKKSDIRQNVSTLFKFPVETVFRYLALISLESLPSQNDERTELLKDKKRGQDKQIAQKKIRNQALPPGFFEEKKEMSVDEKHQKLALLKTRLATVHQIKELQFQTDAYQQNLFQLNEQLAKYKNDDESTPMKDALLAFSYLKDIPKDFKERYEQILKLREEYERDAAVLDSNEKMLCAKAEKEELYAVTPKEILLEIVEHSTIRKGVFCALLVTLAGAAGFFYNENIRYLALLNIPFFWWATSGAFELIERHEQRMDCLKRQLNVSAAKERHKQRLTLDEQNFHRYIKGHKIPKDRLETIYKDLETYRNLRSNQDLHVAISKHTPEELKIIRELNGKKHSLHLKIKKNEKTLLNIGLGVERTGELEAQIKSLEAELSDGPPMIKSDKELVSSVQPKVIFKVIEAAEDVLVCSLQTLTDKIKHKAAKIMTALSDGRYKEIQFGAAKTIKISETARQVFCDYSELSAGDRDLLFISIHFSLLELCLEVRSFPVFFEQAFERCPQSKRLMISQFLQYLASKTQIIVISQLPEIMALPATKMSLSKQI